MVMVMVRIVDIQHLQQQRHADTDLIRRLRDALKSNHLSTAQRERSCPHCQTLAAADARLKLEES